MMTTWSESQRMGRLTQHDLGREEQQRRHLSAIDSVRWKWPVSRVTILPYLAP